MDEKEMLEMLKEDIRREEGFRATAYDDGLANPTIGYGRNLRVRPIDRSTAEQWLQEDVSEAYSDVLKILGPDFTTKAGVNRLRAMVNMRYNLGATGFRQSKRTLAYAMAGNWEAASRAVLASELVS